ncbi:MAG: WYL domain-containing protein [Chromatiales bacterium]|jgi:predicted DNA-binding transcriptional regulator YafY
MDRFDRIFDLHRLLSAARRPVSRARIQEELECSRATAKRVIESMRLYLNAPIKYDREHNGYYYDRSEGGMYELPGVWLNASELHALIGVQQLLSDVQPGLLEDQLAPLRGRIDQLLRVQRADGGELASRVRILRAAARPPGEHFRPVADATARRRRLRIRYYSRARDRADEREVSPQRLVHYRDNWYLDAWCHLRDGLRTFALDAVESARVLQGPAREVPEAELDAHYTGAYGIFAGPADHVAVLRFTPQRARWVSRERWHPRQEGRVLRDGSYELKVPYHDPRELVMDILKYGPDVEVLAPGELRDAITDRLSRALAGYRSS